MLKRAIFQVHWFLGITAGTVLAVMGLTGTTLAFQDELLRALNPALQQVAQRHAAGEQALPLTDLVARISEGQTRSLQRLRVDATGTRMSLARFEGGQKHWRYFDPYTGQQLPALTGLHFFEFIEDLHRSLAAGDRGRAVTGACAITLVFFCLSGLYMRWPRRWTSPRTWLAVEWRRSGRSFLWSLHSVIGTWMMLVYLMIALTGLWWSYDWYREGVTRLLGGSDERNTPAPSGRSGVLDMERLQAGLYATVPGLRSGYLDLRLPSKPGQLSSARVQVGEAVHDRAYDSLQLDPATGAVLEHQTYADMPVGRKLLASVFALHSGSFFGLAGRLIVMTCALGMSLFFVTGWMLYLDRRRKQRHARASRRDLVATTAPNTPDQAPWLVAFASQSGLAEQLAWRSARQLQAAGWHVRVEALAQVDLALLQNTTHALFVLSTFGDGQAPDSARVFERTMLAQVPAFPGLRYALLGLGDLQYPYFCGFSRRTQAWLNDTGAHALFPTVEVDRDDPAALMAWQQRLAEATGGPIGPPLAGIPPMQPWTLAGRLLLNRGSAAGEIWKVSLSPPPGTRWKAGDILQIAPQHAPHAPAHEGANAALNDALPAREYSIASILADGVVDLVVRLTRSPDGQHGLGSGWLCVHADVGGTINARVRRNANFHRSDVDAPMILIGNGTGIAGLRSLLREADVEGSHGHWLIYGERNRAHDHLFADELQHWQGNGHLSRIDLAFSRDQPERIYVQHLLTTAASEVTQWIARGATLHVCGSLAGMAESVDDALRAMLSDQGIEALIGAGRYRRDVY